MEALGELTTVSAKSVRALRTPSTAGLKEKSAQFLKLTKPSPMPWNGVQCQRRKGKGSVDAVLMEPTNLNENSLVEFGRLSEDSTSIRPGSSSPSSITTKSMPNSSSSVSARANTVLQFSGSVEEALSSHAKLKKARSITCDERMRREMIPLHQLRQGGFVENSLMYRQIFVIRSYEVGPDKSTSIREIFSLFQEMALNHVQLLGIAGDGFGATRTMNRLGLIWVVTKMQVDVERYPAWPEVIEIDSWVARAGKNGMRRDWIMRSYQTGEVLARATSTWCMMNDTTRRLSKIPDEVRSEIEPNFMDHRSAFSQEECLAPRITKLDDVTAEFQSSQLKSTPADQDMNQHVNNLKYINWVLESIPAEHIQTHKLASIVLEYRRECHGTDIVQSLTSSKTDIGDRAVEGDVEFVGRDPNDILSVNVRRNGGARCCCEYIHLLRTQDSNQHEILRGKTTWRSRDGNTTS